MLILQVGEEVAKHLKESGVEVKDYNALLGDIKTLAQSHTKLWADPTKASSYMQLLYNNRAWVDSWADFADFGVEQGLTEVMQTPVKPYSEFV